MLASAKTAAKTHRLRQVCGSPSIGLISSDHASTVADSHVGDIDMSSVAAGPASVGEQSGTPVVIGSGPTSEEPDDDGAGDIASLIFAGYAGLR
jgi:streptogramin lyase